MFGRHVHGLGNLKAIIAQAAPKLFKKKALRYALVGLGVLIPGMAIAGTICIENPFSSGGLTPWFSDENANWQSFGGPFGSVDIQGNYSDDFQLAYFTMASGYTVKNEGAEMITSEEDVSGKSCPTDTWITSIRTSGSNSDNMHFKCSEVWKGTTKLRWHSGVTYGAYSDEPGYNHFICHNDAALTGIGCKNSYCDNLFFTCKQFKQ
ncbi:MAG TPA: hypothetical protein PK156_35195 [Polyangium sp.]|nr:hypothetical protein [Polyangium sp.]